MLFLLMKQGCASLVTDLFEFLDEKQQDFLKKNPKKLSLDRRSLMFRGAIQSNGQKVLVKCPNQLNDAGALKKNEEKNAFSGHYFSTR